jgi:hypothetical protein
MRGVEHRSPSKSTWQCWGGRRNKAGPLPQVAETARVLRVGGRRMAAGGFEKRRPHSGMKIRVYCDKDFRYATIFCRSSGLDTAIVIVVFGTTSRGAARNRSSVASSHTNPDDFRAFE